MKYTYKLKGIEYYATNCNNPIEAINLFIANKCGVTLSNIELFEGEIPDDATVFINL